MHIEQSYLSPILDETKPELAYAGEINTLQLQGQIVLCHRPKRTDTGPDYEIGYKYQGKWYPVGVAWLNTTLERGKIPGDKYLSLRFRTPKLDFEMVARPDADKNGDPTPDWPLEPKLAARADLDDEVPF